MAGPYFKQTLKYDPRFQPGKLGSQAVVSPAAKGDVVFAVPRYVKLVGVRESPFVAVCRSDEGKHQRPGRDLRAGEARVPQAASLDELYRRADSAASLRSWPGSDDAGFGMRTSQRGKPAGLASRCQ